MKREASHQKIVNAIRQYLPLDVYFPTVIQSAYEKYGVIVHHNVCYSMIEVIDFTEDMGMLCGVDLSPNNSKIICPLTHLEFDPFHPLTSVLVFFQQQWKEKVRGNKLRLQENTYH